MHLFTFAFYASGVLYALFHKPILLLYFAIIIIGYLVIAAIYPGAKSLSTRKKIMVATWPKPSEGVIQVTVEVRVQKVLQLIEKLPKQNRPTLTHFVIKGASQLLNQAPQINGKYAFGKFIPYNSCDISCLVDIAGGKDLALILITQTQKKSVQQIAEFVRQKGLKIKKNKGDQDHKKRNQSANWMPVFLLKLVLDAVSFISVTLGLSFPAMAVKKNQFGAACVTSLGMLNFENATAPFTGFMQCVFFVSACSVHEKPVIEDGKIVPGKVMNVNFVVDHRYIDGGRAKNFCSVFKKVFQQPELYMSAKNQSKQLKKQE